MKFLRFSRIFLAPIVLLFLSNLSFSGDRTNLSRMKKVVFVFSSLQERAEGIFVRQVLPYVLQTYCSDVYKKHRSDIPYFQQTGHTPDDFTQSQAREHHNFTLTRKCQNLEGRELLNSYWKYVDFQIGLFTQEYERHLREGDSVPINDATLSSTEDIIFGPKSSPQFLETLIARLRVVASIVEEEALHNTIVNE